MTLTADQVESLKRGEPLRLAAPELGEDIVVLRASDFEDLRERREDQQEKRVRAEQARKARDSWVRENPVLTMNPERSISPKRRPESGLRSSSPARNSTTGTTGL